MAVRLRTGGPLWRKLLRELTDGKSLPAPLCANRTPAPVARRPGRDGRIMTPSALRYKQLHQVDARNCPIVGCSDGVQGAMSAATCNCPLTIARGSPGLALVGSSAIRGEPIRAS